MTRLIKLTDMARQADGFSWTPGATHGPDTAGGVIRAYTSERLAMLMAPARSIRPPFRMWEAEGDIIHDDGLEADCRSLTTVRELERELPNAPQRVAFGVLCALEVCQDPDWRAWAAAWLDGLDRSARAVAAAWAAAAEAAAAWAAAEAAAWAAAEAARTWEGSPIDFRTLADKAWAAARAAEAAAEAAAAARGGSPIDFQALADKAWSYK